MIVKDNSTTFIIVCLYLQFIFYFNFLHQREIKSDRNYCQQHLGPVFVDFVAWLRSGGSSQVSL